MISCYFFYVFIISMINSYQINYKYQSIVCAQYNMISNDLYLHSLSLKQINKVLLNLNFAFPIGITLYNIIPTLIHQISLTIKHIRDVTSFQWLQLSLLLYGLFSYFDNSSFRTFILKESFYLVFCCLLQLDGV